MSDFCGYVRNSLIHASLTGGIVAVALIAPGLARAETAMAACDRLAAATFDRDRPEGVAGVDEMSVTAAREAIRHCSEAARDAAAPRRVFVQIGRAYEFAKRPAEAVPYYEKGAASGSTAAMVGLGYSFANARGVKKDPAKSLAWFTRAADGGDPMGMANMASIHASGFGVPVDMAKARALYGKAADLGYGEAMFQLALMDRDGDGGPKDITSARRWLEKAAATGHADALFELGSFTERGLGGARDADAALRLYRDAAARGSDDAKEALERLRCPFTLNDNKGHSAGRICVDAPR